MPSYNNLGEFNDFPCIKLKINGKKAFPDKGKYMYSAIISNKSSQQTQGNRKQKIH